MLSDPAISMVVTPEELVNSQVSGAQVRSSLAVLADGGHVVVWNSDSQDGSSYGVYAQRYDAAGDKVGGEVRINSYTAGEQNFGQVAALAGGGYVVTWDSVGQDGSGYGV